MQLEYCWGSFQVGLSGTKFLQQSAKCLQENFKRRVEEGGWLLLSKPMGKTYFLYACLHSKLFFSSPKVIILCISSRDFWGSACFLIRRSLRDGVFQSPKADTMKWFSQRAGSRHLFLPHFRIGTALLVPHAALMASNHANIIYIHPAQATQSKLIAMLETRRVNKQLIKQQWLSINHGRFRQNPMQIRH